MRIDTAMEKCIADTVADAILATGYKPTVLTIEELTERVIGSYETYLDERGWDMYSCPVRKLTPEEYPVDVMEYIEDCGGIKEFDYEA